MQLSSRMVFWKGVSIMVVIKCPSELGYSTWAILLAPELPCSEPEEISQICYKKLMISRNKLRTSDSKQNEQSNKYLQRFLFKKKVSLLNTGETSIKKKITNSCWGDNFIKKEIIKSNSSSTVTRLVQTGRDLTLFQKYHSPLFKQCFKKKQSNTNTT